MSTGYYLSAVGSISYRDPVVQAMAERYRNYSPSIDWTIYDEIISAQPQSAATEELAVILAQTDFQRRSFA